MKITNLIKSLFLAAVVLSSCTQEPMVGPNVVFDTTLEAGNVAYAGEPFTVKVTRNSADFYTIYSGKDATSTYGLPGATGTFMNQATDSLLITYGLAGEYMLTIVASSTGNQGTEVGSKIDSVLVTVYDRRATLAVFTYYATPAPALLGTIDGDVITAEYVDYPGANYLFKPTFITSSPGAKVYLNEVNEANLQTSGATELDFSNADKVPFKYIVVSPTGTATTYSVKLVKKDPPTDAKIEFIQNFTGGVTHDTATPICINPTAAVKDQKWAIDFFCNNSDWTNSYRLNIVSSFGSTVSVYRTTDNRWVTYSASAATRWQLNAIDSVRVVSQSRTNTMVYAFNVYDKLISSFKFTKANGKDIYPVVNGKVDLVDNTITFSMSKAQFSADLEKLVAEWSTGAAKVKMGNTEIQSGVSELNFKPANATDAQVKKTLSFEAGYSTFDIDVIINLID